MRGPYWAPYGETGWTYPSCDLVIRCVAATGVLTIVPLVLFAHGAPVWTLEHTLDLRVRMEFERHGPEYKGPKRDNHGEFLSDSERYLEMIPIGQYFVKGTT